AVLIAIARATAAGAGSAIADANLARVGDVVVVAIRLALVRSQVMVAVLRAAATGADGGHVARIGRSVVVAIRLAIVRNAVGIAVVADEFATVGNDVAVAVLRRAVGHIEVIFDAVVVAVLDLGANKHRKLADARHRRSRRRQRGLSARGRDVGDQ